VRVQVLRLRGWVMANRLFALVLAAGTIVRLVAVIGYPGANYFHTKPQTVPDQIVIPGGAAVQDIRTYGHASISRVIEPFARAMAAYQRVFWLYGQLFGLIMILGPGGFVRVTRRDGVRIRIQRRRDGPSMMPWVAAVVLLVTPIAIADFDYRYLLPVAPFACLAAGLASAPPAIRPGRKDPQPSGTQAVPGGAECAVDAVLLTCLRGWAGGGIDGWVTVREPLGDGDWTWAATACSSWSEKRTDGGIPFLKQSSWSCLRT
jgi:hypothetical protein